MNTIRKKLSGAWAECRALKTVLFQAIYRRSGAELADRKLIDDFHRLYYSFSIFGRSSERMTWFGIPVYKTPQDLWSYQEILFEIKPDIIVECGTAAGGSAYYLAALCDLLGKGEVITIDCEERKDRPQHPRISYVLGNSANENIYEQVKSRTEGAKTVMCILDSDHSMRHVLREMNLYSNLVTIGSYLIVEDSNINGHPVFFEHGPGPMEALIEFLASDKRFKPDHTREKFLMTYNPNGYLQKLAD